MDAGHAIEGAELSQRPRRSALAVITEEAARAADALHLRCAARVLRASYATPADRDAAFMDAVRDLATSHPRSHDARTAVAAAILACRAGDVERAALTLAWEELGEVVAWQDFVRDAAAEQGVEVVL